MRSLIVTVAGTATRFNKDTLEETLKCLYYIGEPDNCLLSQILDKARNIDEYIIVGGYLYEKLSDFIKYNLKEYLPKIKLVYNPEYNTYGSGYSLIKGIEAISDESEEVIFVEGDLYFDSTDFNTVKETKLNVFTVNHELISAKKAVVVYVKTDGRIRYLYDTSHKYLEIKEPFLAVYNSGQIWKFIDIQRLRDVVDSLTLEQEKGTNLEIIQGYFGNLDKGKYQMIPFGTWFNCNTVNDYKIVHSIITK